MGHFERLLVDRGHHKTIDAFEEKYRPKRIEDVIGLNTSIEIIKDYINHRKQPILYLYGPPSVGKTLLCDLLFSDCRQVIIDHEDTIDKKGFLQRFGNLLRYKFPKQTVLYLENIDKNFTDSLFNGCYRLIQNFIKTYHHMPLPFIVCLSAQKAIKKNYLKASIIHCELSFDKTNPKLIEFVKSIIQNERRTITSTGIEQIINVSQGNIRRILAFLKILILRPITESRISLILNYSDGDSYCSAHEIIHNSLLDPNSCNGDDTPQGLPDLPLINDLIFSNAPHFLSLENTLNVLNLLSDADEMYTRVYGQNEWSMRDNLIGCSTQPALRVFQTSRDPKKRKRVIVKNVLNNLSMTKLKKNRSGINYMDLITLDDK